jgi:hypothetical protein
MMNNYRCEWLPNGYVHVRDMASGLQSCYYPETDYMMSIHWQNLDLAAARRFVGRRDEETGIILPSWRL